MVLTIEIIGENQNYTSTLVNRYSNNSHVQMLSNNISWLANSSGNLDITVKGIKLTSTQSISTNTTTKEVTTTGEATTTTTTTTQTPSYEVTLSSDGNGSWGSSSINITYGQSNTVTITPSSGYKLSSISCTNDYQVSYTSDSIDEQTVTISNSNSYNSSECTAVFEFYSYIKTVSGSNGWVATYVCTDGVGTMASCSYGETLCNGGESNLGFSFMCTARSDYNLYYACNTSYSLGSRAFGGYMDYTITCD